MSFYSTISASVWPHHLMACMLYNTPVPDELVRRVELPQDAGHFTGMSDDRVPNTILPNLERARVFSLAGRVVQPLPYWDQEPTPRGRQPRISPRERVQNEKPPHQTGVWC